MKWFIAVLVPPLAVLIWGGFFSALLNLVLTLCFWFPGVVHAFMVISEKQEQKRHREIIREMQKERLAG